MSNLVQTVIGALSPDMIGKLSSVFGESSGSVSKGLSAATPALLAAALQQSSTTSGANGLLSLIGQAAGGGNPLDRLPALLGDDTARAGLLSQGKTLSDSLLGANSGSVTNTLASFAGIKAGAATQLLSLAAPLVLGAIAKSLGGTPTASGVQSLLSDQRASILGALPPGLGSLFGLGGAAQTARTAATTAAATGGGGFMKILPWLIAAAVVLALIFGLRNCGSKRVEAPPPAASVTPAPVTSETLTLPGGATISVAPGSIGYGVAKFLDSNEAAPKTFVFDNLNFDTASNTLTPESKPTVDTLAAILKAYPNVRTRVVGYTDNQGDPAANKTLSDGRAATVKTELVARGIAGQRIETAGMGEADPIADNATEDGRAKNRRTELVIVRK
ncbi:OmpA family protein [Phenylobacterium sp.]|uniref:OmpA family protein n=1 Tax=Phenylobacterium sp. TaxID=1871053 RepID=UPI0028984540|nr:OmpA family protein [Phenylobacterium sp.]